MKRYTLPISLSPTDRATLEITKTALPDHSRHALARAAMRLGLAAEARRPGTLEKYIGTQEGDPQVGRPKKVVVEVGTGLDLDALYPGVDMQVNPFLE